MKTLKPSKSRLAFLLALQITAILEEEWEGKKRQILSSKQVHQVQPDQRESPSLFLSKAYMYEEVSKAERKFWKLIKHSYPNH